MLPMTYLTLTVFICVALLMVVMQWFHKLPTVASVREVCDLLNSRGGNIAILMAAGLYFFAHSMRLFYYMMSQISSGSLKPDNAIALMALQFATSSAFGGAFGALLKTMTASDSSGRVTDRPVVPDTGAK